MAANFHCPLVSALFWGLRTFVAFWSSGLPGNEKTSGLFSGGQSVSKVAGPRVRSANSMVGQA